MSENSPRIIFMGTPEFAVPSLQILVENQYPIVAVVTAPDKPQGRGRRIAYSPVKEYALERQIPVLQPSNLKSTEFVEALRSYRADLQVVVAFRMLPEVVWGMPPLGTFNLHASYLPHYRGAAPINWAVIQGEKETGITTFMIRQEIDTGNILFQEKEPITEEDTAGTLYERLMSKGAGLVLRTVKAIQEGEYTLTPQETTSEIKSAPKIHRDTCRIDWHRPAAEVRNFIRGLSPYPTAWTSLHTASGEKTCKIYRVTLTSQTDDVLSPGEFTTDNKTFLYIQALDYLLSVDEIQLEGKRRLGIDEFLRGTTL